MLDAVPGYTAETATIPTRDGDSNGSRLRGSDGFRLRRRGGTATPSKLYSATIPVFGGVSDARATSMLHTTAATTRITTAATTDTTNIAGMPPRTHDVFPANRSTYRTEPSAAPKIAH